MVEPVAALPSEALEAMASQAREVSHLYGFLATLYRAELNVDQLRSFRSAPMRGLLAAAGIDLEDAFWRRPEQAVLEDLQVEYTALFLGPGGHISPHESVHIEQQGSYWGDATVAVRRFITATGIQYSADYQGIPDHLSVELEFLGELTRRESLAWEQCNGSAVTNCLEYQCDFLEQHLSQWVGKFCSQVVETAELSFYRDLALMTAMFVASEVNAVAERLATASTLFHEPSSAPAEPGRLVSSRQL